GSLSYTLQSTACASASLTPSPASPQPTGTNVTLTGQATGCPTPEYQFWMLPPGGAWTAINVNYTTGTQASNTSGPARGTSSLVVDARNQGASVAYQAFGSANYTLGCGAPTVTANPSGPANAGTLVTFTAASVACNGATYSFWQFSNGVGWSNVQTYSANN